MPIADQFGDPRLGNSLEQSNQIFRGLDVEVTVANAREKRQHDRLVNVTVVNIPASVIAASGWASAVDSAFLDDDDDDLLIVLAGDQAAIGL